MPAARYWRIVGIETYAGGDLELSELHLYGPAGRLDAPLTSTSAPKAGTLSALQDDNLATTCRFAGAAVRSGGFALMWDFGVGNTADALGVRLGAATAPDTFLAGGTLQYSIDGVQWVFFDAYNRFQYPGAGAYTTVPTAGDLYFGKVSLLLHGDGTNGSTVIADSSASPKAVSVFGNAKISTAQSRFGGASISFDGAGDYLTLAASSDFENLGSTDWTIEFYIYYNTLANVPHSINIGTLVTNRITMYASSGTMRVFTESGGLLGDRITSGTTDSAGQWIHYALVRSGSTMTLYRNGVSVGSSATTVFPSGTPQMGIGWQHFGGFADDYLNGHIDDLRITKGVARYTANFSPPTEPSPNGASSNILLITPALRTNAPGRSLVAASAPVPAFNTRRTAPLQLARDVEVGGPGTVYGTTKTKGSPANLPAKARVVLLHQRSKLPMRETWSDPVTGNFAFTGIDATQQFLALAEDAAGNFRPVAANRLTPEVLP